MSLFPWPGNRFSRGGEQVAQVCVTPEFTDLDRGCGNVEGGYIGREREEGHKETQRQREIRILGI